MYRKVFRRVLVVACFLSVSILPLSAQGGEGFKLISVLVGEGGNIWLPSTIIVEKGKEVKLNLNNLVKKDHGFTIEGLNVKEVVKAGGSTEVTIKPGKEGVFRYFCHLHKGHVGGQLLVQ